MPLPAILIGLASLGAAAVGASAKSDAKATNEKAQELADNAKELYNTSKTSLEQAQKLTETSLMNLGSAKKNVLETSVSQFLTAYERIKNIEVSESVGINELSKFSVEKQDVIQLREMSNIYESAFSSGAAGAATGAVIALAASGSLPIVTGTLSIAGTALMAGEVSTAVGLAGSALSFGAAMTPLAAIAAPVMLFSGISASMKADENLEKAQTMYAEAECASEKMKTSELLCNAISDRADMFQNVLFNLNGMFSYCTALLDGVTNKKRGFFKNKIVDARNFSEDELKLVAITRALAGAVKAVIDTPILTTDGAVSDESETVLEKISNGMSAFQHDVNEVKAISYHAKPIPAKISKEKTERKTNSTFDSQHQVGLGRNVLAVCLGALIMYLLWNTVNINAMPHLARYKIMQLMMSQHILLPILAFSSVTLIIMNNNTDNRFFKFIKNVCCLAIGCIFIYFYFIGCQTFVQLNHHVAWSIGIFLGGVLLLGLCIPTGTKKVNSLRCTLGRLLGCIGFYALALLAYALLGHVIGLSSGITRVVTTILYALFAFTSAFYPDIE